VDSPFLDAVEGPPRVSSRTGRARHVLWLLSLLAIGNALSPAPGRSQELQPPGFDDFGKWETVYPTGGRAGLSPDGRWLAYVISRNDGQDELRITRIADGSTDTMPYGSQAAYSSDSRWIAYRIGFSEDEEEGMRDQDQPVRYKLGIRNLATGEAEEVEGVQSFSFSPDGAYLAMRRYPPEEARGGGTGAGGRSGGSGGGGRGSGGAGEPDPVGTSLVVRELATGRDMFFGNVSELAWQDTEDGHLLALVVSARDRVGNGVQLFDAGTSRIHVLESSASVYQGLSWREDSDALAVFRSQDQEGKEGPTQVVLTWTGLPGREQKEVYDPTADPDFPGGMRTVTYRPLAWSRDGGTLFLGIAPWEDQVGGEEGTAASAGAQAEGETAMPGAEPPDEGSGPGGGAAVGAPAQGSGAADQEGTGPEGEDPDDPASVDIWHWTDAEVMPWQKRHMEQDRRRNLLVAWHLNSGTIVQLEHDLVDEEVTPISGTGLAAVAEWSKYAFERSIGRPGADLYLQDMGTGKRELLRENINDRYLQVSPGGSYLLFMDDGHFWTVDVATREITNVTASAPVSFIDEESDQTSKVYPDRLQKPPFGVAGWSDDDHEILLYDDYDIWAVAPDGSGARPLTEGATEEIRHRIVRPDRERRGFFRGPSVPSEDDWVDLDEPVYLSLYGEWTKKSGYAVLEPGGQVRRLLWEDKSVTSLARAEDADVYTFTVQDFDDSPDLFVGGPGLADARQVTETNAFQSQYAWGRSELIDYTTDRGRKLQGALIYPAGYEEGKQYPMIVYNYELLSQNLHRYVVPSDRSYYNLSVFMTQGYLVLLPDIVFRPRQPGWSVVECIGGAVNRVVEMGVVDPDRIGIVGHSMGGFNTTFVATHTQGMFAAAVAGAPITDLVSYYGDHHWGTGIAETDHIETGQERMEVALYEDLQAYIDNSAVYGAHDMTVPLLLEAGSEDGIVAWYQSIMLYNIARRAQQNVVMVTYEGEDHGLRQEANQKDYQRRILAWFGHYLKGQPAEPWITEGKSALARERELKEMKGGG